jgi:hypothetical protein
MSLQALAAHSVAHPAPPPPAPPLPLVELELLDEDALEVGSVVSSSPQPNARSMGRVKSAQNAAVFMVNPDWLEEPQRN